MIYTVVNEDSVCYTVTEDRVEAEEMLSLFPNDLILITTERRWKYGDLVNVDRPRLQGE